MGFNFTFRAGDIESWDADTSDLVENRDRELELYSTTIDDSFLNLNASNLTSGTVPSARLTGSYTGVTGLGDLGSLVVTGNASTNLVRITNTGPGNAFLVEDSLSTDTTPFVINSGGAVGIGTTTVTAGRLLDVVGGTIRTTSAATQDGIALSGNSNGTLNRTLTIFPNALTGNRQLSFPDITGEGAVFLSGRGTNSAYTTYTPTLTQGVAVSKTVNVARYCQIGKKIHAQIFMTCTSTGTAASQINFTLPQTSTSAVLFASCMGTMAIYDVSANVNIVGNAASVSNTTIAMTVHNGIGYWGGTTLASGDFVMADLIYEVV